MERFSSTGKVSYDDRGFVRLMIDYELIRYYRTSIFANKDRLQTPMHGAHITMVNGLWEVVKNREAWGKYEGRKLRFFYDGDVVFVRGVWFVRCKCPEVEDIREELGLPRVFARRPLHFTIGKIVPPKEVREAKKARQAAARERQKRR